MQICLFVHLEEQIFTAWINFGFNAWHASLQNVLQHWNSYSHSYKWKGKYDIIVIITIIIIIIINLQLHFVHTKQIIPHDLIFSWDSAAFAADADEDEDEHEEDYEEEEKEKDEEED